MYTTYINKQILLTYIQEAFMKKLDKKNTQIAIKTVKDFFR